MKLRHWLPWRHDSCQTRNNVQLILLGWCSRMTDWSDSYRVRDHVNFTCFILLVKYVKILIFIWKHFLPCDHKFKNKLAVCRHCDRGVWDNLSAVADLNHRGQVGNWTFNNVIVILIDCDICSDDCLQNEWLADLFGLPWIHGTF